jgi:hypothetical protein
MQIQVKRTRESTKGVLSGKNWKLSSTISVTLSEAEKALVQKYYDPSLTAISANAPSYIRFYYDGTDESYKEVKAEQTGSNFSNFVLIASVKGHEYLGNLQKFEDATIAGLQQALKHLSNLDAWEGAQIYESK